MVHATRCIIADGEKISFPLLKATPEQHASRGLDHAPENLSCLTVTAHTQCYEESRLPFASIAGFSFVSSCQVLRVMLECPDDIDNVASSHYYHFPDLPNSYDGSYFDATVGDYICVHSVECQLLHFALEDAWVDKLVLRNVPLVYGNVDPDLLAPSATQTIREAVIVFDIEAMGLSNDERLHEWCRFGCDGSICMNDRERLCFPNIGSIGSAVPQNVDELTFVFWTNQPTREVAPMCCYVTETYEEGGDHLSVPNVEHTSCWEGKFWPNLAAAVVPLLLHKLRQITIVNARGIVPTGAQRRPVISAIWAGVGSHDALESKFRVLLFAHLSSEADVTPEKARDCVDRVKFMYMNDWLLSTDSEDVFSPKEVKPWLEFKP